MPSYSPRLRFLLFLRAVVISGEVGAESAEAFSGQAPDADSGTICLFEYCQRLTNVQQAEAMHAREGAFAGIVDRSQL